MDTAATILVKLLISVLPWCVVCTPAPKPSPPVRVQCQTCVEPVAAPEPPGAVTISQEEIVTP